LKAPDVNIREYGGGEEPVSAPDEALFRYLLRLGDTSLVLGQRLSEWIGHAPALEEELGLANLALDLVGQARLLLSYAGEVEGRQRDEDALAFLRDAPEYANLTLAEQPNGDFGHTIARQFLLDAWQLDLYEGLLGSNDSRLAGIAAKAVKETRYHYRFSAGWLVRLGDGTDESHRRAQHALTDLWRFTGELFAADGVDEQLASAGIAPRLAELEPRWSARIDEVLREATLARPSSSVYPWHGKRGVHTEHLGRMLAEMQHLQRAYPGAQW
jgi:ring-1,2-phenylacetyl-CoA epoxidase subunit PaaC